MDLVSPLCSKVMSQVSRETCKFVDQSYLSSIPKANESIDVCEDYKVTNYLNQRDVQEELHAKLLAFVSGMFATSNSFINAL
ncbi:hypothetical protein GLYMA_09G143300v4 [Glycine max]|uniref:Uncharacterized protein n=2 Tax=Glycine subgen. Soja TaxID=1462606 RepID=A0A0R0IFP2_SOYBN|nr:hypothetical protein JHK85_025750 [Glycine max]KAH1043018.1 hypothetical protein GYH30_025043 [Glycine max]KRH38555.1 hypothetical protein GLYMA_09G143300v4 [Glycine max]